MAGICRVGDKNQTGGELLTGASSVTINGKPVALHPSDISPHAPWGPPHPPHDAAKTTEGSATIMVEGKPVVLMGAGNTCGHSIIEASDNVMGQ
jgi:uncharacterized Zn-binding protein involved in type VI secretion